MDNLVLAIESLLVVKGANSNSLAIQRRFAAAVLTPDTGVAGMLRNGGRFGPENAPSGKRFIETVEGDRDAAKRRLGEILKSGEQAASKKITFKDYAERWLINYAKAAIKQSTYLEYERALKVHLYPLFGSKPLVKVTRKIVREMIAAKQQEKLSQSTIRNILAPMRQLYNQAIDDGTPTRTLQRGLGSLTSAEIRRPR